MPNLPRRDDMKFAICFEKDVSPDKVKSTRSWADVVMNTNLDTMQEVNFVSDDEDSVADSSDKPTSEPSKINPVPKRSTEQKTIVETEKNTVEKSHEQVTKPNKSVTKNPTPVRTVNKQQRRIVGTRTTSVLIPKDYNEAHNQWGNHGDRRLKEMAQVMGYKLTGTPLSCDACGIAKATRARVPKTTRVQATKPGERLFVDTTGPFPEVPIKFKYDYSGKLFMMFGTNKNVLVKFITEGYERFKGEQKPVQYLRMDGGGENVAVEKFCHKEGVKVEQTPPYTAKYNGRIERRFPVILAMAMALLWASGLANDVKNKVFGEAVATAAFLHD